MGCICRGKICTITCYTNPPSTVDCGTEDISCSPNPCCDDCSYAVSDGPEYDQNTSSVNCSTGYGGVVGGTKTVTTLIEVFTCEPISPPPPGCATTTTTTTTTTTGTTPPPPSNDCDGGGG